MSRDGALIRRVRPFVDAVKDTPYRDEVLFAGVGQISAEYYGPRGWQTDWRALGINDRPEAFRLVIDHPDLGRITQSFLVGGAP